MHNVCYICGLDRSSLLLFRLTNTINFRDYIEEKMKRKDGFQFHVKEEHNMWNYLFYIAYVESKQKTEYTGHESFVAECLENGSLEWFPINKQ